MPILEIGAMTISLYELVMALCFAAALGLGLLTGRKAGISAKATLLHGALAAVLGLLLGRVLYCAVNSYEIFMDELGEFRGIGYFFMPGVGSVNVIGLLAGLLLAAPLTARLTGEKAARLLDAAVIPALAMYILARFFEPISGQGYGEFMLDVMSGDGYGELIAMEVSVCWVEAALTLLLIPCALLLRKKCRCEGALAQYVLTLWCLVQILPESMRCDNVLYVFIFARVTHLGLAVTLGVTLIRLLVQAGRAGLAPRDITLDALLFACGIGLCIATIFALDKTNLPKLLVYAAMVLSLLLLGFVICRRIRKEDLRLSARETE